MERRFANHQHQSTPLFQRDVRRPHHQVGTNSSRDRRHCMNRARRNHHRRGGKRPARQPASNILHRIRTIRQSPEVGGRFSHFEICGSFAGSGKNQVHFSSLSLSQFFKQTPPVNRSACARHTNDDSQFLSLAYDCRTKIRVFLRLWIFLFRIQNRIPGNTLLFFFRHRYNPK